VDALWSDFCALEGVCKSEVGAARGALERLEAAIGSARRGGVGGGGEVLSASGDVAAARAALQEAEGTLSGSSGSSSSSLARAVSKLREAAALQGETLRLALASDADLRFKGATAVGEAERILLSIECGLTPATGEALGSVEGSIGAATGCCTRAEEGAAAAASAGAGVLGALTGRSFGKLTG
jgi:hypothetical protein